MTYSPNNFGQPIQFATSQINVVPNNTGSTVAAAVPVKITSTGMNYINNTLRADIEAFIGLTVTSVLNTFNGQVVYSGIIPNINTLYPSFAIGDGIWIDSTGEALTNAAPNAGSAGFTAGMYVIKVGTVRANLLNPLNYDLMVQIENRGQL